ncbi:MAG: hypothetical protein ABIQ16_26515 [Polyangiaceae bacterium]
MKIVTQEAAQVYDVRDVIRHNAALLKARPSNQPAKVFVQKNRDSGL